MQAICKSFHAIKKDHQRQTICQQLNFGHEIDMETYFPYSTISNFVNYKSLKYIYKDPSSHRDWGSRIA